MQVGIPYSRHGRFVERRRRYGNLIPDHV